MINDLLDPTGQNLRVREDAQVINLCSRTIPCFLLVACCISFVDLIEWYIQGTYVEGIKEEVVLSPGHALSFIAAGEGTYTNYSCHVLRFSFIFQLLSLVSVQLRFSLLSWDLFMEMAEHRHVGSNNFNLLSSRSHTIFTLVNILYADD